jgi:hypothetical protein
MGRPAEPARLCGPAPIQTIARALDHHAGRQYLLNGRGERSQPDPGDLNVPFRLECVLTGRKRWLEDRVDKGRLIDVPRARARAGAARALPGSNS